MRQAQGSQRPRARLARLILAACVLNVLAAAVLLAQTVTAEHGNIYFQPTSGGGRVQITNSGHDREPNLSPDGGLVVFVRGTPGRLVQGPMEEVEKTELWVVRTDGKEPRLLLTGGTYKVSNGVPVASFESPQFSPDSRQVYFLSIAAVTSQVVFAIRLDTHQVREVCAANFLTVVRKGQYAGDLVVEQHRYYIGSGSYNWVFLVKPDGVEIGPLGDRHDPSFELRLKEIIK